MRFSGGSYSLSYKFLFGATVYASFFIYQAYVADVTAR